MPESARRGSPTPPIALPASAELGARFASSAVTVAPGFVERLGSVCGDVRSVGDDVVEAGRDWWPLTIGWALDGSIPAVPAAVARPASVGEVSAVLALCDSSGVPVTASAGRSGVCGNAVPVFGGVVLDLTGFSGIVDVDDESLLVDVRPGMFGDVLEDQLREDHGLTLGHWPQSIALSTMGGWLACRSAGQYSTRYGKIEDMVVGLEVVLADGRVISTGGSAPRAATGPDLTQLFVGSEGTLGVITSARLRAHPVPPAERRAAYGFSSFSAGLDVCRRVLRRGATPAVLRLYDTVESARSFDLPEQHVLIVLDEGDPRVVDASFAVVEEECVSASAVPLDVGLVGRWLEHRNDVSALESVIRHGITVDTVEIAGRWLVLPSIYEDVLSALTTIEGMLVASAHQSHAYTDGACLYFTFAGRAGDRDSFYREAWDAVMAATMAHGGAISHHHGIGLNRGRFMEPALGPGFEVLLAVKSALDPHGILNPGKLGLPSPFGAPPWP